MKWDYYRPHIDRRVPGNKVDLTPLCNDSEVRRNLILDLVRPFRNVGPDKVASLLHRLHEHEEIAGGKQKPD